jgi:Kef-type K+ transport system membrane component KefB
MLRGDAGPDLTGIETVEHFVVQLGVLLAATAAAALVLHFLKQSSILAYLAVGIAAWSVGIQIHGDIVHALSETGILLLLFMAGLEVDIHSFIKDWKRVLTVGLGQIVLNTILGIGVGWLTADIEAVTTLVFFGLCMTFSSTIVVLGYLRVKREMESQHGQLILGIMVLQDIVAVLALAVLKGMASGGDMLPTLVMLIGKLIALGIVLFLAARYLLRPLFRQFASSSEMLLIGTLGWALGIAALGEAIHFSPEIAAFMAGAALTVLPYKLEIEDKVEPLKSFGIILFFIALGYGLEPSTAMFDQWQGIAGAVVLSVFGTMLIAVVLGYVARLKARTTFMIGGIINQISEFSLILATLAKEAGVFSNEIYITVALACVLSIFLSSLGHQRMADLFRGMSAMFSFLDERSAGQDLSEEHGKPQEVGGHVVLLGYNPVSRTIAEHLQGAEIPILVVDLDPNTFALLTAESSPHVTGFYADLYDPDTWHEAGFNKARLVISCREEDQEAELAILRWLKQHAPAVPFMASTDACSEALELYEEGAVYVIQGQELIGNHVHSLFRTSEEALHPCGNAHRERLEGLRSDNPDRFVFL